MLRLALASFVLLTTAALGAQQPIAFEDPTQPIAFVIRYGDGRIVRRNVGQRLRSWTPMFPRVPGWSEPDGSLPVDAVQYVGTRTDDGLRIDVSVLRGRPHQQETQVATVVLTGATPVSVTGLREVGVAPVELWVEPGEHIRLSAPAVENRTAGLEVASIEPVEGPPAGLIVTVRNVSTRSALSYNFEASSGGRPWLSGRQAIAEAQPVVAPGGSHTFRLNFGGTPPANPVLTVGNGETIEQALERFKEARASGPAWQHPQPDVLSITAVQWTDGTFEGEARAAAYQWCRDAAGRAQVARVVLALRQVAAGDPASALTALHAKAAALEIVATDSMVADAAARWTEPAPLTPSEAREAIAVTLQTVRKGLLDELAAARSKAIEPATARQWLESATARYEAWLSRLSLR